MIVYEEPVEYRGTIEVYVEDVLDFNEAGVDAVIPEWRWRCKSRSNTILASGKGYKRRAGALNAIDAQYGVRWVGKAFPRILVVPWRLVIRDRHGNIERIGAVY